MVEVINVVKLKIERSIVAVHFARSDQFFGFVGSLSPFHEI